MKYKDFKIFKFSTISKNINRIRDIFSSIYKNIRTISGYIVDFLSYIFYKINKSIKFIIYDFKRFKFSTISKNINRIRDIFSSIYKNIRTISGYIVDFLSYIFDAINKNFKFILMDVFPRISKNIRTISGYIVDFLSYIFYKINKSIKFIIYDFLKINNLVRLRRLDFKKVYKYLNIRRYNFYRINKKINLTNYKYVPIYLIIFFIFMGFVYVVIPKFYSYNKSIVEKAICNNQNVKCSIKGKIYYSFFPTPRIKIKDLIINDLFKNKNVLATAEHTSINLSIKNLLSKDKQKFKKIKLNNFKINLNSKNFKEYKNIFSKKNNLIPITFKKGKIIFFDGKNYVATINNANLYLKFINDSIDAVLKGKFLNDDLYLNLNSSVVDSKLLTDIILKMPDMNFLTKVNFTNSEKDKDTQTGTLLIKKGKNKITAVFNYKDNEFVINKSNLRNTFLDGKLEGKITFLPYFNFDLDINLNSINFTKLYNYFLTLDSRNQKDYFKINNKINGKLSLSSDKIYSSYNLVKSIESRVKFSNGNILIEQFLINLGKLGASDLLGIINNDKKLTNIRFESNIFIDNQKKFLSKFGIFNKKSLPSNFFISGNFDLENLRTSFYEISDDDKLSNDDINFIEDEFNDLMLENGLKSLFLFPKFKEFIKSITSEIN